MRRREFLHGTAAGLASLASSGYHLSYGQESKPKRVALIGCGWYGKCDLLRLLQVEPVDVVALCDVDKNMLNEAGEIVATRQKSNRTPDLFGDYRELLSQAEPELVLVNTPDHWHALPMIAAVESGADVWVQKPISVDIMEGQAMLAAARKHDSVVQVGTQRRSTPHLIDAKKKYIDTGRLGKIGLVEIYCYYHMRARGKVANQAPPAHLDYEMWTGPAPMRPYNEWVHPRRWRSFMEYGNGIVGDMCIHMLDTVRWMMKLGWPIRVTSQGGILVDRESSANISDTQTAQFDFGDTQVVWQHRTWGKSPDPKYPWGATFYGENGTLKVSVKSYDFIPRRGEPEHADAIMELDEYPEDRTEEDLEQHVAPAIRGHMNDWLKCIESRERPVADIEEGHISTASCILANLSMDLGRSLEWDAPHGQVAGDAQANERLARDYRADWVHPTPEDHL